MLEVGSTHNGIGDGDNDQDDGDDGERGEGFSSGYVAFGSIGVLVHSDELEEKVG